MADADGAATGAPASDQPEAAAAVAAPKETRERSTVDFPYVNLEEVEDSAKQLFRAAGTAEVTHAQAAAAMNQSATSSAFRVRLSGMRLYGLIEGEAGRTRLTNLGRSIAEAQTALDARVQAFLRVPLYQQVVAKHEGRTLPGAKALEVEFVQIGVAKKQAERARQVFDRSARHAGFLKPGTDRFVTPISQNVRQEPGQTEVASPEVHQPGSEARNAGKISGGGGGDNLDPVIQALVQKLPPPGAPWTVEEQTVWLRMMAMAFTMAYGGKRPIKIELEADTPNRA